MSKINLIIQQEYLSRVRKKTFILLTLLMPFLMVLIGLVPALLAQIKDTDTKQIAVIDRTGKYMSLFEDQDGYEFIEVTSQGQSAHEHFEQNQSLYGILNISGDLLQNPGAISFYSEKTANPGVITTIKQPLEKFLKQEKIKSYNIPDLDKIVENIDVNLDLKTIKWSEEGEAKETSAVAATIIGIIFTFIIYIFILAYGGMIIQAVVQEKSNRIMEVMVSSVKPFELMMGKIIGVAGVGLTQFILWYLLVIIFSFIIGINPFASDPEALEMAAQAGKESGGILPADIQSTIASALAGVNFTKLITCFIIYFIGGYLLYASLFAAIGSMVSQQEDTQQFMMPMTLMIIFAFYAGIYSIENPDGPLAFWTSIFPFTSPIVMMIRLPFDVPLWQLALSIVLLYVTFVGCTFLSAKIYRVGVLMYGKKPTLKELVKWLKY